MINKMHNRTTITTVQQLKSTDAKHVLIKNVANFDILDLCKFEHIVFEGLVSAMEESITNANFKAMEKHCNIEKIEINKMSVSNYDQFIFRMPGVRNVVFNSMLNEIELNRVYDALADKKFSGKMSVYTDQPIDLSKMKKVKEIVYINFSDMSLQYNSDDDYEDYDNYDENYDEDYEEYDEEHYLDELENRTNKKREVKISDYIINTKRRKCLRSLKVYVSCSDDEFEKLERSIEKKFNDIDVKVANFMNK